MRPAKKPLKQPLTRRLKQPSRKPSKSALFDAAKRWDAAAVTALLKAMPELVGATDQRGRTALHIASAAPPGPRQHEPNGIGTVTALLKAGAALEAHAPMPEDEGDFRANAVWFAAARGRNLALVKFLLRRGGDASYALWTASYQHDPALMRVLLGAKPRLNLRAHGETPIFYAARTQRLKVLDLLIKAGADPTIKDDRGRDAIDIAKARRLPKDVIWRLEQLRRRMHAL